MGRDGVRGPFGGTFIIDTMFKMFRNCYYMYVNR